MNDRARFDTLVAAGVRDASEGDGMRSHLVRELPLGHAGMTRTETIMLAAGWSTALVAVFIRLIGIG